MKITKNKIKIVNVIDKNLIGGFIIKVKDINLTLCKTQNLN